ncbi:MAG: DUF3375 family protein [Microlunatus sp.]|nr:DUF3375 family protein [Microlunatus sp.]
MSAWADHAIGRDRAPPGPPSGLGLAPLPARAVDPGFPGAGVRRRNRGGQPAHILVGQLDDELYALNSRADDGDAPFPRAASAYLDEWSSPEKGWLRKYYPVGADEPHHDITPSVEKAVLWLKDLRRRGFVGTESRLNTLFELLRRMVPGADADPESRLAELRRRRAELDHEIARAERGEVELLDATRQRDRYHQFARNARELLADFREVEENFRILDRRLRGADRRLVGIQGCPSRRGAEQPQLHHRIRPGAQLPGPVRLPAVHQRQGELTELLDRLGQIADLEELDRFLLGRAWELRATVRGWDAMYVALAELMDARLLTTDVRLARAIGPRCQIEAFGD